MPEAQKYEMPFEGQPFYRENRAGSGKREKALIVQLQEMGEVRGRMQWVAFILHVDGWDRIDHNSVIGKESWRPVPFEELETRYGEGYRDLRARLAETQAALTEMREWFAEQTARLEVAETRLDAFEKAATPAPSPEKAAAPVAATTPAPVPPQRKIRDVSAAAG